MIVTANLLIKKIGNGMIEGMDITDKKVYIGKFFTDADINKMPKKEKPRGFKSVQVEHDMLLEMLDNANNFNEREKKVEDKIKEEVEISPILKSLKKYITRLEDDEDDIKNDGDSLKIKEEEIQELLECKKVDEDNFDAIYSKIKEEYESAMKDIEQKINDGYNISINSPIIFTGNLTKESEILSKNAYVDVDGKLTGRTSFYSAGVRGDYYSDKLLMALRIEKKSYQDKVWYEYLIDGEFLTSEKVSNIIKRDIATLEKTGQDLLINFSKKEKATEIDEIEEFNKLVNDFNEKAKGSSKRKEVFEEYKDACISKLDAIKTLNDESIEFSNNLINNYDIRLPIKNNYELEQNIKEVIAKEFNVFKNINKKMFQELVTLRSSLNKDNKTEEEIKVSLEKYVMDLYETEINNISKFGTYFRIAGIKDTQNTGYGFITEVAGSSKKVKNFIGFSPNLEELENAKQTIFNKLNELKKKMEK